MPDESEMQHSGDAAEPLALLRFLRVRDQDAFERYLTSLDVELRASGGRRVYGGRVDQVFSAGGGGEMEFDVHLVDEFPTRELCEESLRNPTPHAAEALAESFVISARPVPRFRLRMLHALMWALRTFRPLRIAAAPPPFPGAEPGAAAANPAANPAAAAVRRFMEADQQTDFAMMNLNIFYEQARYAAATDGPPLSGAAAYARYGRVAMRHVGRRGGRPLWAGEPDAVVEGAAEHPLNRPWQQYVLVHYPSRMHIRDMVADDSYRRALPHREAGLARAALMPTTPWPDFAPR